MVLRWKTELTLRASHVSPISVTNAFSSALRGKGNVIPAAVQNESASGHVPTAPEWLSVVVVGGEVVVVEDTLNILHSVYLKRVEQHHAEQHQ